MSGWIRRLFHRRPKVVYPLRGMIAAMKERDAELFEEIGILPLMPAMSRWVERYPEDFPERGHGTIGVHNIKPKSTN